MQYRTLGRTGIRVSALAFGAGPVSGLMTGDDHELQLRTLQRAADLGINWIDTAPGYGQGKSEANIGRAFMHIARRDSIHIATKVRLESDQLGEIESAVRRSIDASLHRLDVTSVTLLQLHNGVTAKRDDEPYSITPCDALGPVLDAFAKLREEGLVRFIGLTGTGQPAAMREVVRSGHFDTIQVPYHLLNPSAGQAVPLPEIETNYGNIIADCTDMNMGVFAIRVFAGGALLGREPSAHTLKTPFFPLDLFHRDRVRAKGLHLSPAAIKEGALRFVLDDRRVYSAIVGFGNVEQVEEAVRIVSDFSSKSEP
jgi:aryl-alcohol dehydrogenase-like predicted oxidoreductase